MSQSSIASAENKPAFVTYGAYVSAKDLEIASVADFDHGVAPRRFHLQPKFRYKPRHVAHDPRIVKTNSCQGRIHSMAEFVIGKSISQRGVIAVKDGHNAAWAHDASHLAKNCRRLSDMTNQSVCDNRVECRSGKIKTVSITDSKIDSIADIFVLGESARSINERKTLINAERLAGKVVPMHEKSRRRARAAADLQYLSR